MDETTNLRRVRALLDREWRLLIDGELAGAQDGRTFDVVCPFTEQVIASVPDASATQVAHAVERAEAAFPAWRDTDPRQRAELVRRLADIAEDNLEDLALLDAVDGGAPAAVMARDVHMAAELCRYFAGLVLEMKGYSIPASGGVHFTVRQPFGVVAKIIPFNHPILFAIRNLTSPLVAGNCVIVKPAEATPLSALYFAELIKDVFPPGVVQVVVGDGPQVPRSLVRHPAVSRIGFTGSEATGRAIQRDAAEVGVKDVTLELGGKNALIAYPDADPQQVAEGAVHGMNFTWSGQSCGSTSRLLVHESIADDVLTAIVQLLDKHTIGSPLDPGNDQGSLASAAQYNKVQAYIDGAVEMGAVVVTGGGRPPGLERGYFIAPTVLDRVDPGWPVATDEVFGPVLSVIRWDGPDDAIAIANSVKYGLTGSIFTNDIRTAHQAANALDTGYVWINTASTHVLGMPFGGHKSSGLGREECLSELLSYTQEKAINVAL